MHFITFGTLAHPIIVFSVKSCEENCIFDGTPFSGAFEILLQTDAVALYVWLEAIGK